MPIKRGTLERLCTLEVPIKRGTLVLDQLMATYDRYSEKKSLPIPQAKIELQLRGLNILHLGFLAQEHLL